MRKRKGKRASRNSGVIALGYMDRYVYPIALALLPVLFNNEAGLLAMGIGFVLLALYDFIGYTRCWKHIYCSLQSAHRRKMTPNDIRWDNIKKSDAYGGPIIFGIWGTVMIVIYFVCV